MKTVCFAYLTLISKFLDSKNSALYLHYYSCIVTSEKKKAAPFINEKKHHI